MNSMRLSKTDRNACSKPLLQSYQLFCQYAESRMKTNTRRKYKKTCIFLAAFIRIGTVKLGCPNQACYRQFAFLYLYLLHPVCVYRFFFYPLCQFFMVIITPVSARKIRVIYCCIGENHCILGKLKLPHTQHSGSQKSWDRSPKHPVPLIVS